MYGCKTDLPRTLVSKTAKEVHAFGSAHSEKLSLVLRSIDDISEDLHNCRIDVKSVTESLSDAKRLAILDWISSSVDPSRNYNRALKDREKGTGKWFLESSEYSDWVNTPGFLWLLGIRK